MYQVQDSQALLKANRRLLSRRRGRSVASRTVILLGLTSLFTDISSEMVATILPLYLVYVVGLSPLAFGVVDGLYQGSSALVRIASGLIGDRFKRHKEVAVAGYGLSAFCKVGFLAAGGAVSAIGALVFLDRTGKGIRTAPRDALISLSTPRERLGSAFGIHRALDTTGAMLGPLIAFGLLALAPLAFDAVFVVSFGFALIGLLILTMFVPRQPRGGVEEESKPVSLRAAARLLVEPRFRALVLAGGALALVTMSDGFLYLGLQRRLDFDPRLFPLLFVGTALVYMLLAVPMGRLADRIGRARVFIGGYLLLLLVYTSLLLPTLGVAQLVVYLVVFGAFYASTDGVLMALASAIVPEHLRGSGLALLVTVTSLARLAASILFGLVWTAFGIETAVVVFGAGLVGAMVLASLALWRTRERPAFA